MCILELGKTHISGKLHIENQKVDILQVHDFSLMCETKITFAGVCLLITTNENGEIKVTQICISRGPPVLPNLNFTVNPLSTPLPSVVKEMNI